MIVVEYSPDATLTGILRTTLQTIRALSNESDLYLLVGLKHPMYEINRKCFVKFIKQGSICDEFDEDLARSIETFPSFEISLKEISRNTIFYPR